MTRPQPGEMPPPLDPYAAYAERGGPPHGHNPRPKRRKKQRTSFLSWIGLGLLTLIGLAGGAAAVLVLTMPKDFVRDRIAAEVKARTGRDLIIAGPASFTVYPSIGFSLADVSLSSPQGFGDKPLVKMSSLDVSVRLLPLLSKEIEVERLILRKPVFELHVDQSGRTTWDMAALTPPAPAVRLAQAGGTLTDAPMPGAGGSAPSAASTAALQNVALGDVRIEDGEVRYSDTRSGARQDLSKVNLQLQLQALTQPLMAKGDLVWRAEKIDLDAKLTSLKAMLEKQPAKLALTIASPHLNANYDGSFVARDAIDAEGAATADAASVRNLMTWLGTELPSVPGFGPMSFKGQVRFNGKTLTVSNASFGLDGATGTGNISVDTAPARPYIRGALQLSELDLNKYIAGDGSAPPARAKPAAPAPAKGTAPAPAQSIEDLLGEGAAAPPGPRVKGFTQRAGWSEGQIDASALTKVDADVKLTLGRLLVNNIKVGKSLLGVALKAAALRTTLEEVQLYGGKGTGFITIDAAQPQIVIVASNLNLDGIAAQPLLQDAAGMDWLAGTGKLTLALSGQGRSQKQIVETLTGNANIVFANGAIVGWNIPGMVRNITQGKLSGLSQSPTEKTDFSELSSTWQVTNGLARNDDLKLVSPLLRVSGAGNVMLPPREIDYLVRPTLVASLEGQGAATPARGLEIPVKIQGSWDKPKITPDLGGVLKDPNQAVEAVKQLGQQFKGKSADDIVKGLLGGDKSGTASGTSGTPATEPSDKDKAKQLLEGLFKR